MNAATVKDLMIPISEYASISENAGLAEAQLALEEAQAKYNKTPHSYQSVLVTDHAGKIIGMIRQIDVLVGIEPKYKNFGNMDILSRFGFPPEFYEYMTQNVDLLQKPLDDLCRKAARIKVKDIMQSPQNTAHIEEDKSLNQGIHQFVVSNQPSLMVTRNHEIVGILRLADVIEVIGKVIKSCD